MTQQANRPSLPARKLPPGKFNRAHDRFELQIPVTVEIMIPEDTFRPHGLAGHTVDVSNNGMQVILDALRVDLYSRLLARPRHVRVTFRNPVNGEQVKLTGRIAWIDYRKPRASDAAGECNLGIVFSQKEDGVDLRQYFDFIEGIQGE